MPATKSKRNTRSGNGRPIETAEVLTLAETAIYLRISEAAVLQAVQTQRLPGRQFGTEWRFFKPALQEWMKILPRPKKGILAHIGAFKDDPDLEEIVKDAYRRRARPESEEV